MMHSKANNLRILSQIAGRVRLHLPDELQGSLKRVEKHLDWLPGVQSVRANPLTGNILIHFDSQITTTEALTAWVAHLASGFPNARYLLAIPGKREPKAGQVPGMHKLFKAGLYGVVGHALIDAVFYAVTFSQPFGLPLAGLGVLHLGLDVLVWTAALGPLLEGALLAREDKRPTGPCQRLALSAAG
jgi:hypothetical protein